MKAKLAQREPDVKKGGNTRLQQNQKRGTHAELFVLRRTPFAIDVHMGTALNKILKFRGEIQTMLGKAALVPVGLHGLPLNTRW